MNFYCSESSGAYIRVGPWLVTFFSCKVSTDWLQSSLSLFSVVKPPEMITEWLQTILREIGEKIDGVKNSQKNHLVVWFSVCCCSLHLAPCCYDLDCFWGLSAESASGILSSEVDASMNPVSHINHQGIKTQITAFFYLSDIRAL